MVDEDCNGVSRCVLETLHPKEGFDLSSSVELSTDCTTVSSAVDSPTAGAATPPLKVHVVSALDPEVIVVVEKRVVLCSQAERTADNLREGLVSMILNVDAHLTRACDNRCGSPSRAVRQTLPHCPEPLQANSAPLFSRNAVSCLCTGWLESFC